ncbi:MAG: M20 family metallopeptidase, partial [Mesorhizobium sp.]
MEEEARRAHYVLVTEPARDGGKIVTSRRGSTASFELKVTGRSAHSLAPQHGRSAVRELARQILDFESMSDYDRGLTMNVGLIGGGTSTSIVPDHAFAKIGMYAADRELGEKTIARVRTLKSYDPDVTIEITAKAGRRPGYEKSREIEALFQHARELASEIG